MTSMDIGEVWSTLRAQIDAHRPGTLLEANVGRTSIPVTLLTGFLGAGKSSLLVHLLQNPGGLKIRALVNDVGSLPFDPTFVEMSDDVHVELTNGCGCCVSTTDLALALDELVNAGECDLIVLEASGSADPTVLAHVVHANGSLCLNRTVVAVHGETLLSASRAAWTNRNLETHLSVADCIVVTNCDALSEVDVKTALQEAAVRAPGRTVNQSSMEQLASHVLAPSAPRGTHLSVNFIENQHVNLCVQTVEQHMPVVMGDLLREIECARPGLVRAKGRLSIDGKCMLVQVTPHSVNFSETQEGPTSITLISEKVEDTTVICRLLTKAVP